MRLPALVHVRGNSSRSSAKTGESKEGKTTF